MTNLNFSNTCLSQLFQFIIFMIPILIHRNLLKNFNNILTFFMSITELICKKLRMLMGRIFSWKRKRKIRQKLIRSYCSMQICLLLIFLSKGSVIKYKNKLINDKNLILLYIRKKWYFLNLEMFNIVARRIILLLKMLNKIVNELIN